MTEQKKYIISENVLNGIKAMLGQMPYQTIAGVMGEIDRDVVEYAEYVYNGVLKESK